MIILTTILLPKLILIILYMFLLTNCLTKYLVLVISQNQIFKELKRFKCLYTGFTYPYSKG